jgi:hypothetical protein
MSEKKVRGRKPSNKKSYFDVEEEEAVRKFLSIGTMVQDPSALDGFRWSGSTNESRQRDKIYKDHLKYPLDKMVESIIRKYKLYPKTMSFEDAHSDALSFLMIKFHKFKPDKDKKSYSYFGTICKRYLLGRLIKDDKKIKSILPYEDFSSEIEDNVDNSYEIDIEHLDLTELIQKISEGIKEEMTNKILTENIWKYNETCCIFV